MIAFKEYLLTSYSPVSVNSILAAVNGLFSFQGWHTYHLKTVRIQKKIFCQEERQLSKQEYIRLLNAAKSRKNERLYMVMLTLCATGIRVSELAYVTVEAVKNGQAFVNCKNKNRVVLIPQKLGKVLQGYIKRNRIISGQIFLTKNGRNLDRTNLWRQMKKTAEKAGVAPAKVFPHNLRHLFARTYYEQEKDIVKLADILGHSQIDTTRIYTISSSREHARQICRLGLIV